MAFEIYRDDNFIVTEMTEAAARVICTWKYPEPYAGYNFYSIPQELEDLLSGLYVPVYFLSQKLDAPVEISDSGIISNPVGFISWGPSAKTYGGKMLKLKYLGSNFIDFALGLSPENCGRGLGAKFMKTVVKFIENDWPGAKLRLTVESDNARAKKVYEKFGFETTKTFKNKGQTYEIMCFKRKNTQNASEPEINKTGENGCKFNTDEDTELKIREAVKAGDSDLTPVKVIATQVVAGLNYGVLCTKKDGTKTVAVVYRNLGNEYEMTGTKPVAFFEGREDKNVCGGWGVFKEK